MNKIEYNKNLYNQRFQKINRKTQRITYLYLILLGLIFISIFYVLISHIELHIRYKNVLLSKLKYPKAKENNEGKPESSKMPHFKNINHIKNSLYRISSNSGRQPEGLGLALLPRYIVSPLGGADMYIKSNNQEQKLKTVFESDMLTLYRSETDLIPVKPDVFADISVYDIIDEVVLFTLLKDRFSFSPGIISSKHSIIDNKMLIETDIRFSGSPQGSLLLSAEGSIIGFSIFDIDGSLNFFIPANELFSIVHSEIKDYLKETSLNSLSYLEFHSHPPYFSDESIKFSQYALLNIKHLLFKQDEQLVLYLAFLRDNKPFMGSFSANIVIETLSGKRYIKHLEFSKDLYQRLYLPESELLGVRLTFDIEENEKGPAVIYAEFDNYKSQPQRVLLPK